MTDHAGPADDSSSWVSDTETDRDTEDVDSSDVELEDNAIQCARTEAGANLITYTTAQSLLQDDWGAVLGAAPSALGRLGQCFVIASSPMASSLILPKSAGLLYESLRANLVHCSDLGRKAFQDAESKMKKISIAIGAVCETDGMMDMILEAVEDADLVELELPEQLRMLQQVSHTCVADTKSIKEKVKAWSDFADSLHRACVEQDETLGRDQTDLAAQIQDKQWAVENTTKDVSEIQKQAEEYRSQIADRKTEFEKAQKALPKRGFPMFGSSGTKKTSKMELQTATVKVGAPRPLSGLLHLDFLFAKKKVTEEVSDKSEDIDVGYTLAGRLSGTVHQLHDLLIHGPEKLNGVSWEQLAGRGGSSNSIRSISQVIHKELRKGSYEHTSVIQEVQAAMRPVEDVLSIMRDLVGQERSVSTDVERIVTDSAKNWLESIRETETSLGRILGAGSELEKQREQLKNLKIREAKQRKLTKAERRFERFRMAQHALFDAEGRLNQRRQEERRALQEFHAMQQELQRLDTSKITMAEVKEIVGKCVMNLKDFCDKVDQLTEFFTNIQTYINDIAEQRVTQFNQTALTTATLRKRMQTQTDETARSRQERIRERKLQLLKVKALELRGRYLVAQTTANMYVEVSKLYIMPSMVYIDRLSLPSAERMSSEALHRSVEEVGILAKRARTDIGRLANARRDEFRLALSKNQGEIEEFEGPNEA